METTKKAYDEILKVLNKHKDLININIEDLETKAKLHLFGLELKENYGLNINPKEVKSTTYNIIGDYLRIYKVGANENSKISWSDDGRQPDKELLLNSFLHPVIPIPIFVFQLEHTFLAKIMQLIFSKNFGMN